jgi:hypothetical protein
MENIEIFDNVFSNEIIDKIKNSIVNWENSCIKSNFNKDKSHDSPFWTIILNNDPLFNEYIKNIIENIINKQISIIRVYAVSQTYGHDGNYHTDDIKDNCYTFCLYINEISNQYDGFIYIKIPNKKEIIAIEPNNNRCIFFKSNYIHKGTAFTNNNDLRICITWKLLLI